MKLRDRFEGRENPFEGDRTLRLQTLPVGAQISSARVIVTPYQCVEQITFRNGVGDWGATKESNDAEGWVAVDFHARRMVSQIRARIGTSFTNQGVVTVQADFGGAWLRLADDGTISTEPDDRLTLEEINTSFANFPLPPLVVQRLKLQWIPAPTNNLANTIELNRLTIFSYPSNMSLGLGEMPPFWARPGELTQEESSPDFAEVLQSFLAEAEVANGFYDVPLVVYSDSIACLDITVEIEYVTEQTVLPAGVTETTMPFKYNSLPETEGGVLQMQLPVGARVVPGKTSGRVIGAFQESRVVHGPTGEVETAASVSISADQSQAHPILLAKDTPATAVDLLLAAESPTAVLDLVLLGDTDGKPGPDPLLPEPVTISLDKDIAEKPTWISTNLPAEFQFKAGTRYWLGLQARSGQVRWSVNQEAADVGLHFTDNGGLSWRQTAVAGIDEPVAGLFRLRHVPPRFQMPIELLVGTGDAAQHVSLERFAPMRRVDFNLDFNEVAEAINRYLEEGGPVACPEGEHLANGDFAEWMAVGDNILPPQSTALDGTPLVVAVSPDDRWIYVAGLQDFRFIDTACNEEVDSFELEVGRAIAMAVHPDGKYVYLLTARFGADASKDLLLINTVSRRLVGDSIQLDLGSDGLALSPDGRRLNIIGITAIDGGDEGWVQVFDTAELSRAIVAGEMEIANLTIDEIRLGADRLPREAVVTSDGAFLLIAARNDYDDIGEIHVIATTTGARTVIEVEGSRDLRGISLIPGEARVVVTDAFSGYQTSANAFLVNFMNGSILQVHENSELATYEEPQLGTFSFPTGVVVSPDGQRAFIIDQDINSVLIIDLRRFSVTHAFSLVAEPRDIAITPQGDHVYIPITNFEGFTFLVSIAIGNQFPTEWTLTSGSLSYSCFADPLHRAVVLGFSSTGQVEQSPTALSQLVPVGPSCSYELTFWGRSTDDGAVAEILWLGGECGLQQTDEVVIEVFDSETEEAGLIPPELVMHRLRTAAPARALQAEIRFTVPGNVTAVVDQVSFQATQEAIDNNDFQSRPDGELAAWSLSPAGAAGLSLGFQEGKILLRNNGLSPFALVQTIAVTANRPFTLTFQGRATVASPTRPPHLELRWLSAAESQAADTTILAIDPVGPDIQLLSGTVPVTAVEAELHLVLPGRTTLAVSHISFRPVELVQVPLNFVAQAPGELTIFDFRVAFDTAVAPLPPIPETGLCTPTPPGQEPGSRPGDCCFCPCCGGDKLLNDPQPTKTAAGRTATRGTCPDCGAELVQPGGQLTTARAATRTVMARPATRRATAAWARARQPAPAPAATQPPPILPMEEEIAAILPMTPAEWADLAGTSGEITTPPLTIIKGIGTVRAEQLGQLGLNSVATLAEADPEEVAAGVKGVSVEQAYDLIAEAKAQMILAEAKQAPLVSSLMPTYNRPLFAPKAIEYFLRQDYPHRELIIVDDGTDPIEHLVPDDERIHYVHLQEKLTIGAKMNVACEVANGAFLARWEDDVWMDYWRLSYQVAALLKHQADICGPDHYLHYDVLNHQAWHSTRLPGKRPWILGSTLCFTRSYWERNSFPDMNLGDEIQFIRSDPAARIVKLQAITFLVDIIHGRNTAPKDTSSQRWHSYPVDEIQGLMGSDWVFYRTLSQE